MTALPNHSPRIPLVGLRCLALLALIAAPSTTRGQELDFDRDVAPLLSEYCLECHNPTHAESGLDLSQRTTAIEGGESGGALTPGDLEGSLLWQRIAADEMPPQRRLTAAQRTTLRRWITAGATWGTEPINRFAHSTGTRAGYDWWSLQPLQPPPVPEISTDWGINQIDRFVWDRLHRGQLSPAPRADPRILVRRLYFDLLGLPPTMEVVEQFASSPTQQAWEELIDELLASKHYGERWAQHWLDLARFGETDGYEYNLPRNNAWHFRDWVIRALNADLPYNEFVRMQIAGDLLSDDAQEGAAAVGFLVAGIHNTVLGQSEAMKLASRHEELEEIAGTVAQTFLGLTVNCARCHDHKFDPITQREYYQFIAALDGVTHGERKVRRAPENQHESLIARKTELEERLTRLVTGRGARVSNSANWIRTSKPMEANRAGVRYSVTIQVAPTVFSIRSQATTERDGLDVRIQRQDGSRLAGKIMHPVSWDAAGQKQQFSVGRLEYVGDGTGPVHLWIGSRPTQGRFGGAIDDLRIVDETGLLVFEDNFDQLHSPTNESKQSDTGLPIFWGLQSEHWTRGGLNTVHAVEYESGNFALQIFSGWIDAKIESPSEAESELIKELAGVNTALEGRPIFTVIPRAAGVMRILQRGDPRQPGSSVRPAALDAVTHPFEVPQLAEDAPESKRRRHLAEWITDESNPLFHRVIVNRLWYYHFGQGIVATPNDFGFNGGNPSHPDLLDWMAVWFREEDYSLKSLHRLICASATYQQASRVPNPHRAHRLDAANRLLWRQNVRRLDAETVRDSMLAMALVLDTTQFGAGYRDVRVETVGSAHYYRAHDDAELRSNRRTIYRWHARGERSSLLESFDCPDPSATAPKRSVTTTATQALSHWNHALVLKLAGSLAKSIESSGELSSEEKVRAAWHRVLVREPNTEEFSKSVQLVEDHGLGVLCRVLFNSSEAIVLD